MDQAIGPPGFSKAGGEGTLTIIHFDDFRAYWEQWPEVWNSGWVTRVWRIMITRANQFGLQLIDDPQGEHRSLGKAVVAQSLVWAPIRRWESPRGGTKYNQRVTGLATASIVKLLQYRQALAEGRA